MIFSEYNADSCPKCNYPANYKGIYTPGSKCGGCGYLETDEEIVNLNKKLEDNIKERINIAQALQMAIVRKYDLKKETTEKLKNKHTRITSEELTKYFYGDSNEIDR